MVVGQHGIDFPADIDGLRAHGTDFLTTAFRTSGALSADNAVTHVDELTEVTGGSTGRKALLSVRYARPEPALHTRLFVKFSRDFDDPARDGGRFQMESEVRLANLALSPAFPVAVPRTQFADYHAGSGTGILITERITFGCNGIEPQYHKAQDNRMPDQFAHYRALLSAVAALAGTQQSGLLPAPVIERFPLDLRGATVGDPPPMTPDKLSRRLDQLAEFASAQPDLLPERVRDPAFLHRLAAEAPLLAAREDDVWAELAARPEYIALCHWNANVDNAWFYRTADGALACGLMDWGCVGRMNVAMAIWGALCAAETTLWEAHFDDLLRVFADGVRHHGGAELDPAELGRLVLRYAAVMGMAWLLDVPARLRARFGPDPGALTRSDPRIADDESLRAPLQMLANLLNLWALRPSGEVLDLSSRCVTAPETCEPDDEEPKGEQADPH